MVSKLKQFFWICSGADIATLKQCPSESTKYAGIGATIFFTGLFAALAAAYALFTVFDNIYAASVFGLLWGLMIFNLDRYIVSSMRKRGDFKKELLMATPRLLLAIIISIVIAKPLELKIFEKEINGELSLMQQEDLNRKSQEVKGFYTNDITQLDLEVERLKSEILTKEEERNSLQQLAREEADGTGGTGQRNAGPIYRIKKADAERANEELTALKTENQRLIDQKLKQQDSLNAVMASALLEIEQIKLGGMASRLEALSRLEKSSDAICWASLFIMILFIAVECAPVLVKLMSPEGPYDQLIRAEHYDYKAAHHEKMAKVNTLIKKRKSKLTKEEQEYVEDKLNLELNKT
ncbi:DUF4407 domain-containing protein [Fulvivirga sp. RKSG066]|uniref:DUF4407 domain-containing protein n=1 Tax=Fulvivirga aurantia TaxID=2529383 RepID=UPI0012BD7CD7|nr:DUF4407 domain-containing protein [Fulvivirga aurantia]MTI20801.1 DUF4407 domain-containing protein [Fulvivirga aurantia]